MLLEEVVASLKKDDRFMSCVSHWETIPARAGSYVDVPDSVHPRLLAALAKHRIDRLYSHQREAYEHIRGGRNVVVVTPTASGKTLSYNLPVLDHLLRKPESRAMPVASSNGAVPI